MNWWCVQSIPFLHEPWWFESKAFGHVGPILRIFVRRLLKPLRISLWDQTFTMGEVATLRIQNSPCYSLLMETSSLYEALSSTLKIPSKSHCNSVWWADDVSNPFLSYVKLLTIVAWKPLKTSLGDQTFTTGELGMLRTQNFPCYSLLREASSSRNTVTKL